MLFSTFLMPYVQFILRIRASMGGMVTNGALNCKQYVGHLRIYSNLIKYHLGQTTVKLVNNDKWSFIIHCSSILNTKYNTENKIVVERLLQGSPGNILKNYHGKFDLP